MRSGSGWVVYLRDENGDFIRLTKPMQKKEQAEKRRDQLSEKSGYRYGVLGVGFVK